MEPQSLKRIGDVVSIRSAAQAVRGERAAHRTCTETAWLKQFLKRQGCATVANDAGIAWIGARTRVFQLHLFAARATGSGSSLTAKVLVDDTAPVDVLKMAILAATDETYRRCLPTFPVIAHVF